MLTDLIITSIAVMIPIYIIYRYTKLCNEVSSESKPAPQEEKVDNEKGEEVKMQTVNVPSLEEYAKQLKDILLYEVRDNNLDKSNYRYFIADLKDIVNGIEGMEFELIPKVCDIETGFKNEDALIGVPACEFKITYKGKNIFSVTILGGAQYAEYNLLTNTQSKTAPIIRWFSFVIRNIDWSPSCEVLKEVGKPIDYMFPTFLYPIDSLVRKTIVNAEQSRWHSELQEYSTLYNIVDRMDSFERLIRENGERIIDGFCRTIFKKFGSKNVLNTIKRRADKVATLVDNVIEEFFNEDNHIGLSKLLKLDISKGLYQYLNNPATIVTISDILKEYDTISVVILDKTYELKDSLLCKIEYRVKSEMNIIYTSNISSENTYYIDLTKNESENYKLVSNTLGRLFKMYLRLDTNFKVKEKLDAKK